MKKKGGTIDFGNFDTWNIFMDDRGRYPALGHFSFLNFFKLLLVEIWKNKNNGLKEW